jgi:hypothetical protein
MSRCWGYDAAGDHIVESEAAQIRACVDDLLVSHKSQREVVAGLRARNVHTSTGGMWTDSAFHRFILYPRLAGLQVKDDQLIPATWPAIITVEQHHQLVALLTKPSELKKPTESSGPNRPKYMLSGGLLTCGVMPPTENPGVIKPCGKDLYSSKSRDLPRAYICRKGSPTYGCGRLRISAGQLEALVGATVMARLQTPIIMERLRRAAERYGSPDQILGAIDDVDARLRGAGGQYARRELSQPTLEGIEAAARTEKADLRERLKQAERLQLMPDSDALAEWWVDARVDDQRELVSLVLDHIVVKPALRRGNIPLSTERLDGNNGTRHSFVDPVASPGANRAPSRWRRSIGQPRRPAHRLLRRRLPTPAPGPSESADLRSADCVLARHLTSLR